MVTADADLNMAAQKAGVDLNAGPVMTYLKAIKIQTSSTIAVYFKDTDAVQQATVQKLVAGITVRGMDYKLGAEDPDAVTASWIVLYEIVKMKYQANIVAAAPTPRPTPTPPTTTSSTTDEDTVPKTLPAGVYNQLVKDYNDVTLREFPEKVLLGADKVLARMHHEHTMSKHYTAVTLGEIMSQRVFTALGTVNSARKKDDLDKRLVVDNKHYLVSKEPSDWDVRGLNMIQDGIDAVLQNVFPHVTSQFHVNTWSCFAVQL